MKHTEGWMFDEIGAKEGCPQIINEEGSLIAQVRGWGYLTGTGSLNLPMQEAAEIQNSWGRIMAAAPDVLSALKALVKANEEWNAAVEAAVGRPPGWFDGYLDGARAAIAKSERRS